MVGYNQKGYVGQSMSVRARQAYESGEMPLSKWSKQAIIEAMEYDDYSQDTIEKAKGLPLNDLRNKALYKSSYHHTGMYANKTNFFSLVGEDEFKENMGIRETISPEDYRRELENLFDYFHKPAIDKCKGIITKDNNSYVYYKQVYGVETPILRLNDLWNDKRVFVYGNEQPYADILKEYLEKVDDYVNQHNNMVKSSQKRDSKTYIVKVKL